MNLPYGVNLIFEEDAKYFWLSVPYYNKGFTEALSINMIDREWHKDKKKWLIPSSEFETVYDLVDQFYGAWRQVPVWGFMENYSERREQEHVNTGAN